MDWKRCDILLDDKINSDELFDFFEKVYLGTGEYILLAIKSHTSDRVYYKTMWLDYRRCCAIIGDEELYVWHGCRIVGWQPIEELDIK